LTARVQTRRWVVVEVKFGGLRDYIKRSRTRPSLLEEESHGETGRGWEKAGERNEDSADGGKGKEQGKGKGERERDGMRRGWSLHIA
jgi:hypothetical protein